MAINNLVAAPAAPRMSMSDLESKATAKEAETKKSPLSVKATCSHPDCVKPVRARNLCSTHYTQWRKGLIEAGAIQVALCKVAGCQEPVWGNGLCTRHNRALKEHGDPLMAPDAVATHCIYEGCNTTELFGRDLCQTHYMRMYRFQKQLEKSVPLKDEAAESRRLKRNSEHQSELSRYWREPKQLRGTYKRQATKG